MMTDTQLQARDAQRDIGSELLAAVRELKAGKAARKTTFESLPDGSVRRAVSSADGTIQSQETLVGPHKACSNQAFGARAVTMKHSNPMRG